MIQICSLMAKTVYVVRSMLSTNRLFYLAISNQHSSFIFLVLVSPAHVPFALMVTSTYAQKPHCPTCYLLQRGPLVCHNHTP